MLRMHVLAGLLVLSLIDRATAQSNYTVTTSLIEGCGTQCDLFFTTTTGQPVDHTSNCSFDNIALSASGSADSQEVSAASSITWGSPTAFCAKISGFAKCEIQDLIFTGPAGAPAPLVSSTMKIDVTGAHGNVSWRMTGTGFSCIGCSGASCCGTGNESSEITSSPYLVSLDVIQTFTYDMSVTALAFFGESPGIKAAVRFAGPNVFNLPPGYTVNSVSAGIVDNQFAGISTWTDLGSGLAGVSGIPSLVGTGTLLAGTSGSLELTAANPSALAMLFVSLSSTPAGFKGGTLVPFPALLTIPLATLADGTLPFPFIWPAGIPAGTALWFQYAVSDLAAVKKVALSNAVMATTP